MRNEADDDDDMMMMMMMMTLTMMMMMIRIGNLRYTQNSKITFLDRGYM